ncbi:hypothetical protein EC950183_1468, partial [Escherichia coli 95.0183]
MPQKNKL